MKFSVLIPMRDRVSGVLLILQWIETSPCFRRLGLEPVTLVVDDSSSRDQIETLRERVRTLHRDVSILSRREGEHGVRDSFLAARDKMLDRVLVIETDIIPSDETFVSMWKAMEDPSLTDWNPLPDTAYPVWGEDGSRRPRRIHPIGKAPESVRGPISVSPIYTTHGNLAYPSQPTWTYPNDTGNCFEIRDSEQGRVGLAMSVPFAFSLWYREAFDRISKDLPPHYHLDAWLGIKLWSEGWYHLRLLDHSVEHVR